MKLWTIQLSHLKFVNDKPCVSMVSIDVQARSEDEAWAFAKEALVKWDDYIVDSINEN